MVFQVFSKEQKEKFEDPSSEDGHLEMAQTFFHSPLHCKNFPVVNEE